MLNKNLSHNLTFSFYLQYAAGSVKKGATWPKIANERRKEEKGGVGTVGVGRGEGGEDEGGEGAEGEEGDGEGQCMFKWGEQPFPQ